MSDTSETQAMRYFSQFRESHLGEYTDAMREYRVGGRSGYQTFAGSEIVVQAMQNIHGALDESFADLSVPRGFVTPKARQEALVSFLKTLRDLEPQFRTIAERLVAKGRLETKDSKANWRDTDFLPEPFIQIDRIRNEVADALEHTLQIYAPTSIVPQVSIQEQLRKLLLGFHRFIVQLGKRHDGRATLAVGDEYDVQDALHALLKLHFADVRAEDYTPAYAGGASRIDFLLNDDSILIEVKKTRKTLKDRHIGEQVAIDMARYRTHQKCKVVYFFIYDPDHFLANPDGLIKDLSKTIDGVEFHTVIVPEI